MIMGERIGRGSSRVWGRSVLLVRIISAGDGCCKDISLAIRSDPFTDILSLKSPRFVDSDEIRPMLHSKRISHECH